MKVTYTNVIKFPATQRLFEGSDGHYYLADESADELAYGGHRGHVGRPDETDDGPLRIVLSEPLVPRYEPFSDGGKAIDFQSFSVTVEAVNAGNDRVSCGICMDGALFLAARLGMTIRGKFPATEYRVNELPKVGG